MLKRIFFYFVLMLMPLMASAQQATVYPIDLTVMLTPPYTTCLQDLSGTNRFQVNVLLRDLSRNSEEFVIEMKVNNNSGQEVFRSYFGNFALNKGKPTLLSNEVQTAMINQLFSSEHAFVGGKYVSDCLPEGVYEFTFQAFASKLYPNRRVALSRPSTFMAFLQSSVTMPYLIYPYDDEPYCQQVIPYQWQSSNITGTPVSYTLEVVELMDDRAASEAFNQESRVLKVGNLYTSFYMDNVTAANYRAGNTYAWRVTATPQNGTSVTSDVRTFIYCGEKKPEEVSIYEVIRDNRKIKDDLLLLEKEELVTLEGAEAKFSWVDKPAKKDYCAVSIEIRKQGQSNWTPFLVDVNSTTITLDHLSYDVSYELRGQYVKCDCDNISDDGMCDSIYGPYSKVDTFLLSSPRSSADCDGGIPELTPCAEDAEIVPLKIGDFIKANGTIVQIDSITPGGTDPSVISGVGHVASPMIKNIQLKMEFKNIKVNCAHELVEGKIVSVYDLETCAMFNLEELLGEGSTGGSDNPKADAQVKEMTEENLANAQPGDYFMDEEKNVFMKTASGEVRQIGKMVSLNNSQYVTSESLSDDSHYIQFSNPDPAHVAFDDGGQGYYNLVSPEDYEPFDIIHKKYIIPWLANNPGRSKKLLAHDVFVKNSGDRYDSVMFVIPAGDEYLSLNYTVVESTGYYSVEIPGTSDVKSTTEVYVLGSMDEGATFSNAGLLKVANYKETSHKVNIVSLTGEPLSEEYRKAAEDSLNTIYGRLGVSFEVTTYQFDDEEVKALIDSGLSIGAKEESRWIVETAAMRTIRKLFKEKHGIEDNTAYLFVVGHAAESDYSSTAGDMPRKQSAGYLFKDVFGSYGKGYFGRLVAHEIGHGIYCFEHTFEYKRLKDVATDNLMDYHDGSYLAHYQWRLMRDSVMFVWSALQDDEDGMAGVVQDVALCMAKQLGVAFVNVYIQRLRGALSVDDVMAMLKQAEDSILKNCKFDPTVVKIYKKVEELVNCYYNSNSEEELDYCLCTSFLNIPLADISSLINEAEKAMETIFDTLSLPDFASGYLSDKLKGAIKSFKIKLDSGATELICGKEPKTTEDGRYKSDNFDVYLVSCDGNFATFEIDIVTAIEDPLRAVSVVTTTENEKTIVSYLPTLFKCNYSSDRNAYTSASLSMYDNPYYAGIPNDCSKMGEPDYLFLKTYEVYTWRSVIGGFDLKGEDDGLGPETDGRFHYQYSLKVPCPKGSQISLSVRSRINRGKWPRNPKGYRVLEKVKDLTNWLKGLNPDDYKDIVPVDSTRAAIASCGFKEKEEEKEEEVPLVIVYSDECTKAGYDKDYIKNPFGTGDTEEEATKNRRKGEERYGVPKCSGWKKDDKGVMHVSPLSCGESSRVKNLYTITEDGRAVIDPNVAEKNLFKTFHYWDGSDSILLNLSGRYEMMHLDDFIATYLHGENLAWFMLDIYTRMNAVLLSDVFQNKPLFAESAVKRTMGKILRWESGNPDGIDNMYEIFRQELSQFPEYVDNKLYVGSRVYHKVNIHKNDYSLILYDFYKDEICGLSIQNPSLTQGQLSIQSLINNIGSMEQKVKTAIKDCNFTSLISDFIDIMCGVSYPLSFPTKEGNEYYYYKIASTDTIIKNYPSPALDTFEYYSKVAEKFFADPQKVRGEYKFGPLKNERDKKIEEKIRDIMYYRRLFQEWENLTNLNSVLLNRLQMVVCYTGNRDDGLNSRLNGTIYQCGIKIPQWWKNMIQNQN